MLQEYSSMQKKQQYSATHTATTTFLDADKLMMADN
jgi:hypothetical protein